MCIIRKRGKIKKDTGVLLQKGIEIWGNHT